MIRRVIREFNPRILRMNVKRGLKETNFRTLRVNIGDTVRVNVGDFRGTTGTVQRVLREGFVHIDNVYNTKVNQTRVTRPVHVSNCTIIGLNKRVSRRL